MRKVLYFINFLNYQGLVPVLINALIEQDAKMKKQQSEIETYRDEVSELKEMVQAIASRGTHSGG